MTQLQHDMFGLQSCPSMHVHGPARVIGTYDECDPLAVSLTVEIENPFNDAVDRRSIRLPRVALYDMVKYGVVGQNYDVGSSTMRRRISVPAVLSMFIRWDGGSAGSFIWVDVSEMAEFLEKTITVVPLNKEQLDMDRLIARLLYS